MSEEETNRTRNKSVERELKGLRVFGQLQVEDEIAISNKSGDVIFVDNKKGKLEIDNREVAVKSADGKINKFDLPESVVAKPLSGYAPGKYSADQVIYKFIIDEEIKLKGFDGEDATGLVDLDVNEDSKLVLAIEVNREVIGSITFDNGATIEINNGDDLVLNSGDIVSIVAPSTSDPSAQGLAFILPLVSLAPTTPVIGSIELRSDSAYSSHLLDIGNSVWVSSNDVAAAVKDKKNVDVYYFVVQAADGKSGTNWRDVSPTETILPEQINDPADTKIANYTTKATDLGKSFRVVLTAVNEWGQDVKIITPTGSDRAGQVIQDMPINTSVPRIVGSVEYSQDIEASSGGWANDPEHKPTSISYQWQKKTSSGYEDISGKNDAKLTNIPGYLVGEILRVKVIGETNTGELEGVKTTVAYSADTVPVFPALPEIDTNTITGDAKVGQTLTIVTSWKSGDKYGSLTTDQDLQSTENGIDFVTVETSGNNYTVKPEDIGKRFRSKATANNASGRTVDYSELTTVVPDVIVNPPVNTVKPVISGVFKQDEEITVDTGEWENDPTSFAYQAQVSDNGMSQWTNISGATSNSYLITVNEAGKFLRWLVTAINNDGQTNVLTDPSSRVLGLPPSSLTSPTLSGGNKVGETLTVDPGEWTNNPVFNYEWIKSDNPNNPIEDWEEIGNSSDSPEFIIDEEVEGKYVRCRVKASNEWGEKVETTNASSEIEPARGVPENIIPPSVSGNPTVGESLYLDRGEWTNTNPLTAQYTTNWYATTTISEDWELLATPTSFFISEDFWDQYEEFLNEDNKLYIRAGVVVENDIGKSAEVFSNSSGPVEYPKRAPELKAAPIVSGSLLVGQRVDVSDGVWSWKPTSFSYQLQHKPLIPLWADVPGETNDYWNVPWSSPASGAAAASKWRWKIIAHNDYGDSAPAYSGEFSVSLPPDLNISSPIISGSLMEGMSLSSTTGDWKENPTSYNYQWQSRNPGGSWANISGATSSNYILKTAEVGKEIRVGVAAKWWLTSPYSYSDPTGTVESKDLYVPQLQSDPETSGDLVRGQRVTVSNGTWSKNPTSFSYQLQKYNNLVWTNVAGQVNYYWDIPVETLDNDRYRWRIVAQNEYGESSPAYSNEMTGFTTNTASLPQIISPPEWGGDNHPGGLITSTSGSWSNNPTEYEYKLWGKGIAVIGNDWYAAGALNKPEWGNRYQYLNSYLLSDEESIIGTELKWRVRAKNEYGWSESYSESAVFEVDEDV